MKQLLVCLTLAVSIFGGCRTSDSQANQGRLSDITGPAGDTFRIFKDVLISGELERVVANQMRDAKKLCAAFAHKNGDYNARNDSLLIWLQDANIECQKDGTVFYQDDLPKGLFEAPLTNPNQLDLVRSNPPEIGMGPKFWLNYKFAEGERTILQMAWVVHRWFLKTLCTGNERGNCNVQLSDDGIVIKPAN